MNIKCLFNKHEYVPIQYVNKMTLDEWTYIVHCARCHKESVHDVNKEDEIKEISYLVDFENDVILNYGITQEMLRQLDQSHGNLSVVSYENLTKEMKIYLNQKKSA